MLQMDKTLDFSKVGDAIEPPNLIEIQTLSYARFLQAGVATEKRVGEGLEGLLREIFPIISYDEQSRVEYVSYSLGEPRYTPDECRELRLTYGKPFRVRCRLVRRAWGSSTWDRLLGGRLWGRLRQGLRRRHRDTAVLDPRDQP